MIPIQVLIMGYGVKTMATITTEAHAIRDAGNEPMISLERWGRLPVPYYFLDEEGNEGEVWENEGALPELEDEEGFEMPNFWEEHERVLRMSFVPNHISFALQGQAGAGKANWLQNP